MPQDDRTTKEKLIGLARTVAAKGKGDKLGYLEDKFVASIAPAVSMHRTLKQAVEWISNHLNPEDVFKPEQLVGLDSVRDITIPYSQMAEVMSHIGQQLLEGKAHHTYGVPVLFKDGRSSTVCITLTKGETENEFKSFETGVRSSDSSIATNS